MGLKSPWPLFAVALIFLFPIPSSADLSARFRDLRGNTIEFAGDLKVKGLEGLNSAGYKVSETIWDKFSDVDAFSSNVGRLHFGIKLQRSVDDDDNGETFTVTDRIEVPLRLPIFSGTIGSLVTAELPISFSVGLSGGIKMTNIRQVHRGDKMKLKSGDGDLKLIVENISKGEWYKTAKDDFKLDEKYLTNPHLKNPELGEISVDPLRHARYHRVLNRVAFPMRIPLKAAWISRMGLNEVMKYEGYGGVSFGPSVGWNFEPLNLRASASVGAFLNGRFEISIMKVLNKEKKERVWLKVHRAKTKGISASIGGRSTTDIDGFVLMEKLGVDSEAVKKKMGEKIGGDKVADFIADLYTVNFVPINKSVTRQMSDIFEVGYEFNLNDPQAREAYEMAALGLTHVADHLAIESFRAGLGDKAPVRKIFGKKAKQKARIASSSFEATFLLNKSRHCRDDITNAIVEFPTGQQQELRGKASCRMEEKGLFGNLFDGGFFNDSKVYSFHFEGAYIRDLKDARRETDQFGMYAIGYLQDKKTSGIELARYSDIVRKLIHNPEIIPAMPKQRVRFTEKPMYGSVKTEGPPSDPRGYENIEAINYGRTDLQLAIGITREQLSKFLEVDDNTFLSIMMDAFDTPYIHDDIKELTASGIKVGRYVNGFILMPFNLIMSNCKTCTAWKAMDEFYSNWKKAKKNRVRQPGDDPEKVVQSFRKMFRRTQFGYEFARILVNCLKGEKVNYELNFRSGAFDKPIVAGGQFDIYGINTLQNKFAKTKNYDIPRMYLDVDESARVGSIDAKVLDTGKVRLRLKFDEQPNMVRFYVKQAKGWSWNRKIVAEVLVRNVKDEEGQLTFPKNALLDFVLDPNEDSFAGALGKGLDQGEFYEIGVQVSRDGKTFGPVIGTDKFHTLK